MMILRPIALVAALLASLGGCTLFSGNKIDNPPAKQREALEVPPDLARPAGDGPAAVPAGGATVYSDYTAKLPTIGAEQAPSDTKTENTGAIVRLERDGSLRWLVVQDATTRVALKTRDYFLRHNMKLVVDNATVGLLETDWIDRPVKMGGGVLGSLFGKLHSTGLRDKYRVRIERGRASGTSEVYVSHQAMEEVVTGGGSVNVVETAWQPRPADPAMEAEMLGKLMVDLGLDEQQAKRQLATGNTERALLIQDTLSLPREDLDSAWRRVTQALDRSGVTIEDRDRSAGLFYVRYLDKEVGEKSGGLLSWVLGSTKDEQAEAATDRFQVKLEATAADTTLSVLNVKGEKGQSKTGTRLLNLLYQQLR